MNYKLTFTLFLFLLFFAPISVLLHGGNAVSYDLGDHSKVLFIQEARANLYLNKKGRADGAVIVNMQLVW